MAKPHRKQKRYVNKKHLDWVHEECGCIICGRKARGHHIRTKGAGGGDEQVVPLCSAPDYLVNHHDEAQGKKKAFEKKYGCDLISWAYATWMASPHNEVAIWDLIEEDLG